MGPNASGKSNILDALRFISDIARLGTGGLHAAVEARGGFSAIRCLHARNPAHVELSVTVGTDEEPDMWTYLLRINQRNRETQPSVASEAVTRKAGAIGEGQRHVFQDRNAGNDSVMFAQTLLEQSKQSAEFREVQTFLSSCRYLHVVPQVVRDPRRAISDNDDPFGGDLLKQINDTPERTRAPRLRRIAEALRIAVLQFKALELWVDSAGVPHLRASYEHWRATSSWQIERFFSDGTLRLIGLLWALAERGGPLLLEEPELSLNEAIVREFPAMLRQMQKPSRRQALITTHSPALLDGGGIGLTEVYRIDVGSEGSKLIRLSTDLGVAAQVEGGSTISEAVLPLLSPSGADRLGKLTIAA